MQAVSSGGKQDISFTEICPILANIFYSMSSEVKLISSPKRTMPKSKVR